MQFKLIKIFKENTHKTYLNLTLILKRSSHRFYDDQKLITFGQQLINNHRDEDCINFEPIIF